METSSQKKAKRPLRWVQVLIVAVTLASIAVTVFLGNRAYQEHKRMVLEQFNEQQLVLARSAASGIKTYFSEIKIALISAVRVPAVQRMTPDCLKYMLRMYVGFLSKTSIRRLDENGVLRFIYPFEGWRGKVVGRDYNRRAFFQRARNTGHVVSEVVINEQGDRRIRIAAPVYLSHGGDDARGKFKGVLVVSFDPDTIAETFISPIVSGKTGYAWLINQDGIFLAHHESGFVGRNAFKVRAERNPDLSYKPINQIQRKMMAGEEGADSYVSGRHRGRTERIERLIAYSPVHINGHVWSVAVCAPASEVDWIMRATGRSALYAFGFAVLILIGAGGGLFITTCRWSHSLEREVESRAKELKETRDYLSKLIKHTNAPTVVWNSEQKVTIFNRAFVDMSGRSEAEMIGRSLEVLFPEDNRLDYMYKIESASRGEDLKAEEIPILRKDGEMRTGLWSFANIYVADSRVPTATLAQGQDITERNRLEGQLRHAQKMEAVGTLAGGVAHDFNNILQAVSGYIELLLIKKEEEDPDRDYLNQVSRSVQRAAGLVQQLLIFSRKVESKLRSVDLNQEITDARRLLERTIPRMVDIELHPADGLKTINADPIQLEQIVMNLAVNARDAMPDGGRLIVETENVVLDDEYSKLHLGASAGEYVLLTVSDTGCGMDRETLDHIFEPFFTTKDVGTGTGLGLATVYSIVKSHGGYIMCYSELGQGTTFKIYFPVLEAEVTEQAPEHEEVEEIRGGDETILLVDDEETILDIGCAILGRHGYTTITAESGEEAIEVYKKEKERIDLVILDIGMPGMGGYKCLQELLKINTDVKVIITSGYAANGRVKETLETGAAGFVGKPYQLDDMLKRVREVLDKKAVPHAQ